nr:DUF11 domain-containing protein [uncultured Pseudoxanthomonas sp.]
MSGVYYISRPNANNAWEQLVYAFDTNTNTFIGQVARVATVASAGNGDLTFDACGNMYLVASGTTGSYIYRIDRGSIPTSSSTALVPSTWIGTIPSSAGLLPGLALDGDGWLYATTTIEILKINPTTGAVAAGYPVAISGASGTAYVLDLADRNAAPTLRLSKDVTRLASTDQFQLQITPGTAPGNTATTNGSTHGVQAARVGHLPVIVEQTYTLTKPTDFLCGPRWPANGIGSQKETLMNTSASLANASLHKPSWKSLLGSAAMLLALAVCGQAAATETLTWGAVTGGGDLLATPMSHSVGGVTVTTTATQSEGPWEDAPLAYRTGGTLNGVAGGRISMDMNLAPGASLPWIEVQFTFSRPVTDLEFTLIGLDGGPTGSWNDRAVVNSVPAMAPTVVSIGSQVSWTAATRTAQATSNANIATTDANIHLRFPQPVTSVTLRYVAGSTVTSNPLAQLIGIGSLSWHSGAVRVSKSTAPGFGGPFSFSQANLLTTPANITTTAASTPTPASPAAHEIDGPGNNVTLTESPATGWVLGSASCTDANSAVTGNTGTLGTLSGNTVTLNASSLLLSGSNITCTFNNVPAPPPDFGTCDARMFMDQVPTNTSTLFNVNYATAPFTLTALGSSTSTTGRNALGYNVLDNYMYGIKWPTGGGIVELIRVGSNGAGQNLGVIAGLPVSTYNNGVISPAGDYYLKTGFSDTTLYRINLATLPYTATAITLSQPVQTFDLAWHNGLLYGVDTTSSPSQLVSIDPVSGAVTTIGPTSPLTNALAMWGFNNMLLGSTGGAIYALDPISGAGTLLSVISPSTNNGDGANCPTANIAFNGDLSVTKTNTPASGPNDLPTDTYSPGETRTYTIVVTNLSGSFGAQNITVSDPIPTGIDAATVSWSCANTSGGSRCGAASGTGALNDTGLDLPPNAVATYQVTMTVPASFTGDLTNTVAITPSSTINDTNAANNTATDVDQSAPQLTIRKISIGGVDSFGFTGTNGVVAQTLTTTTAGSPVSGATQALTAAGTATTITESTTPATYQVTDITCTGLGAGGMATPDLANRTVALDAAATAAGANVECTFTNTLQQTDIQVVKTASPDPVISGDVVTYQIVASNNGPQAASNVLLTDVAGAGQDCTTPSTTATCTATGGASCPSPTVPVSSLLGAGVTIPTLPVGGTVTFGLQCTVTASGL